MIQRFTSQPGAPLCRPLAVQGAGAVHPACMGGQAGLWPIKYLILFSFSFSASFLKTFKILIFQKKSKHLKKIRNFEI
jgi:hypothetical protein